MFWSPDSRFIAFDGRAKLLKIDVSGGPPQTLCDNLGALITGGSWNRDGVVIFGVTARGLMRVSAGGGAPSQLVIAKGAGDKVNPVSPVFLPDGRHLIYYNFLSVPKENEGAFLASLDAKPEEQNPRKILATDRFPVVYVPSQNSGPGWLLFVREQTLMAQPFDDERQEISGDPIPVASQIALMLNMASFSASTNGERFLVLTPASTGNRAEPFSVILNCPGRCR